jgi:hypothetical protein
MDCSIDIDLFVHLGDIINIDLLQRGIYVIEVSLFYGLEKKKIVPIGLFSSPSHLDSHVGDTKIPGSDKMLYTCEVDEETHIFRTRSVIIRYKNEKHELNEGVSWRITLPHYHIQEGNNEKDIPDIICPDLMFIQFALIRQDLLEEGEHTSTAVNKKASTDDTRGKELREIASLQTLAIQCVDSDFHQYFPVS